MILALKLICCFVACVAFPAGLAAVLGEADGEDLR